MAREQDFYKEVAEKLIDQLQKGTAPWQRPWEVAQGGLPRNPTTGEEYHGGNVINLLMQEYRDPRWMTFRQASEIGARVRKGEHGTRIIYWRFEGKQPVLDEDGKPKLDADGKQMKEEVRLDARALSFPMSSTLNRLKVCLHWRRLRSIHGLRGKRRKNCLQSPEPELSIALNPKRTIPPPQTPLPCL